MAEPLRKFVNRPTRYFFTPDDDHFIKFSGKGQLQPTLAEMLNISSTGVAFIIDKASSPKNGELIKLEFNVPGGEPMAWWGRVRRVTAFTPTESWASTAREDLIGLNMIGVEFENFPAEREQKLNTVLNEYFSSVKKQNVKKHTTQVTSFFHQNWGKLLVILCCCLTIAYILYLLSQLHVH